MQAANRVLVAILATMAMGLVDTVPSLAALPHVSLTLPGGVDVGSVVPISWKSAHLEHGTRLVVQRPVGTARVWKTVLPLRSPQGNATLPAYGSLGAYPLRIAAIRKRKVVAQQRRSLHVFGSIPFSELIVRGVMGGPTSPGVFSTPTAAFKYVTRRGEVEEPVSGFLRDEANECESVHIEFAVGLVLASTRQKLGQQATLTLVQERADPVSATVGEEVVGTIDARVTPGQSWAVNTDLAKANSSQFMLDYYVNGSAMCYGRSSKIVGQN